MDDEQRPIGGLPDDLRGQSETVGIVLLLAMVVTGGSAVLWLGSAAMTDLQAGISGEEAEHAMREVDSRLSRVAFSENDVETLDFGDGGSSSRVEIRNESEIRVVVNGEPSHCRATIGMGSIVEHTDSGQSIAYEGGGVWRRSGNGSVAVSPPDFQYRNGTIDFPLVSVDGTVSAGSGRLVAEKNTTRSRQRSREIARSLFTPVDRCQPARNVTITVHSDYYEAWGRYFGRITPQSPTYDHAARTATVTLSRIGGATDAEVNVDNVTADEDYVARIEVLGTEGSVTREMDGDGDGREELNDPYSAWVVLGGERRTPWRDGRPNDGFQFYEDNLNRPWTGDEPRTAYVAVPRGVNLSVEAAIHNCDGHGSGAYGDSDYWEDTGVDETGDGGHSYDQYRCTHDPEEVLGSTQVQIDSRQDGGSNNLVVLKDGDTVPGQFDDKDFQRSLEDLLGDKIDDDREVHLDDNQVVFVYELSSKLDDGDDPSEDDFNDAVVLVTFHQQGAINPSSTFSIKISASQVSISDE